MPVVKLARPKMVDDQLIVDFLRPQHFARSDPKCLTIDALRPGC